MAEVRWHSAPVTSSAPHFKWREFFDWHVSAPPPLKARPAIKHLAVHVLEPLRHVYGPVRLFSAYRTHATNRSVGGAPHSHHLYDEWPKSPAVDLGCRDGTIEEWVAFLERLQVGGLGVYPGHVHVDLRKTKARWNELA